MLIYQVTVRTKCNMELWNAFFDHIPSHQAVVNVLEKWYDGGDPCKSNYFIDVLEQGNGTVWKELTENQGKIREITKAGFKIGHLIVIEIEVITK